MKHLAEGIVKVSKREGMENLNLIIYGMFGLVSQSWTLTAQEEIQSKSNITQDKRKEMLLAVCMFTRVTRMTTVMKDKLAKFNQYCCYHRPLITKGTPALGSMGRWHQGHVWFHIGPHWLPMYRPLPATYSFQNHKYKCSTAHAAHVHTQCIVAVTIWS